MSYDCFLVLLGNEHQAQGNFSLYLHMDGRTHTHTHIYQAHLHISTERMRVYTVLAGLMVWEAYDCHVNVCEGLDWKRTFALHLWYHCQPSAPFRDALEEYVQAFQVGEDCR